MKKKKKLNKQIKYSVIISLMLLSSYFIANLSAKYKIDLFTSHSIESKEFYFSSDIMANNDKNVFSKNWDGTGSLEINFNVKNYENMRLCSPDDISYQISVEKLNDANNELNAEVYQNNKLITENQKLVGNKISESNYVLKVSKSDKYNDLNNLKLKLVLKSTSPFVKEISREIQISIVKTESDVKMINYSDYVELNFQVNGDTSNKNIAYDNTKLILDKSNLLSSDIFVKTNDNINSFNLLLSNYQKEDEFDIVFIKKVGDYDIKLGTDIIIN